MSTYVQDLYLHIVSNPALKKTHGVGIRQSEADNVLTHFGGFL